MLILGIETSCDETAAAIVTGADATHVKDAALPAVLSNVISSQIEIHRKYGGVVPEVAAREHVLNILPVIDEALTQAGVKREDAAKKLQAIAVTTGPGLITSLQVGVESAKTLAMAWNLPIISVNHISAHIYANFIGAESEHKRPATADIRHSTFDIRPSIKFPAVILTVSGGHTMLVLMRGHGRFETIGETLDDAAGEAFDKAASMLGIGYPGGPAIAAAAAKMQNAKCKMQNDRITLPRPMISRNDFDFSFSGLKTALRYALEKDKDWRGRIPAYAAEFQQAAIDVLIKKTIRAAQKHSAKTVMLAGGVSANKELREQLTKACATGLPHSSLIIPQLKYTTDNAAMVAAAGYYLVLRKKFTPWTKLKTDCNAKLQQ